jgi:ribosomal protein S12 methylthiotransferase
MTYKIGLVSLGCAKNQTDAETMLAILIEKGCEIVTEPSEADVIIVNTCGFIDAAKQESIETILEMAEYKEAGNCKKLIVTGCLAERYADDILNELPEVDAVLGTGDYDKINEIIQSAFSENEKPVISGHIDRTPECELPRLLLTPPYTAYLKIADGCDNNCTYCAIPMIRGKYRSVPMEDVLAEAKKLAENGITELVLIAQDTSRYGEDLYGESRLPQLLKELCKIEGLKWIRTLYCYPERITDELLDTIAEEEKLVKYLEIPIQHCDGKILSAMNRWGDEEKLEALFAKIRSKIPNVILRTTLITGFPDESEEQFNALAEFVDRVGFDRLGCFPYSPEEGTKAASFENQIDEDVAAHRADIIMEQQLERSYDNNKKLMDSELEAVVEGYDRFGECFFGRTALDAPDIDGKVFFTSEKPLKIGDYVKIKITDTLDYDLIGEVIE